MKFQISFFILCALLISCSSTRKKKTSTKKEMISAEQNIDQLIKAIKGKGGEIERFVIDDMFLKASHASIRGDVKTALFYWEKILILNSDNSFINKKYAVDLIRSGNLTKAKTVLEKIDKKNGANKDENLTMVLAGLYVSTGEKEKARKIYSYLVKNYNNSEACVFLGRFYAEEKKYSKADKTLKGCENKNKKAIFAFFRGKIALEQKKVKQAKKHFKRALKIGPEFQEAALQLGKLYEDEEKPQKTIRIYKKFLEKNQDNFSVLSALVKLFFSQGTKPEIIPFVERLSSLDQENLNLKVRLGILYSDVKRYEDAVGVFSEILEVVPTSEKILYYLASLYQQLDNLDKSVKYYLTIPDSGALFKDAQIQVAKIYKGKSYPEGGVLNKEFADKLTKFVNERSLKYPLVEFDLKMVLVGFYENVRDFKKAVVLLETLLENTKFKEEHNYYLASLLDKDDRFEDARIILENMLVKNPNNPHALNFLAYSLIEKEIEMDQAYELLIRARKLKPDDGYIRDSIGWYYYKKGMVKKALVEVKKAWQKEKSDVVITLHLAKIYQDLKRYRMAEKYFSEALKNCKQDHERMEVLHAMEKLEKIRLVDSKRRLPASLK